MNLIDGTYTSEQAKAILLPLIRHKIQYHELAVFSNSQTNKGQNGYHLLRLDELFQLRDELKEEIDLAEKMGLSLKVKCELFCSLESVGDFKDQTNISSEQF